MGIHWTGIVFGWRIIHSVLDDGFLVVERRAFRERSARRQDGSGNWRAFKMFVPLS